MFATLELFTNFQASFRAHLANSGSDVPKPDRVPAFPDDANSTDPFGIHQPADTTMFAIRTREVEKPHLRISKRIVVRQANKKNGRYGRKQPGSSRTEFFITKA